jgi:mRNA interferase MazF
VPLTEWTAKKGKIKRNVRVEPSVLNGLSKLSLVEPRREVIADCLQTRPIDRRLRLVAVRGELEADILGQIER